MADSSQVGDIDTKILLDCVENITTATTREIKYIKPSGDSGSWTAVAEGTTSMYYLTQAGDLDESGNWCLQTYVILSGGWTGHGEMVKYVVKSNG